MPPLDSPPSGDTIPAPDYTEEYVHGFVEKWDELIDWERRSQDEGSFFIDQLKRRGVRTVLDAAVGSGFHSVRLLSEGFETISVDGSSNMLAKVAENGRRRGCELQLLHSDWRWLSSDVSDKFDAIICLGNSFTHLFSEDDRRAALAEFHAALNDGGVLIIDQRNFDNILDNGFTTTQAYCCTSADILSGPVHVSDDLIRFRCQFPDQAEYFLNMYPLRKEYMRTLIREAGFSDIETYGDLQADCCDKEPDFLVHVASRP